MYGGCALSTEQSEAPPKAAADSRGGWGMLRSQGSPMPRAAVREGGSPPVPLALGSAAGAAGSLVPWAVWARWPPSCAGRWSAHWPPDGTAALKTWEARGRGGTHCFRAALLGRTGVAPSGHGKICAPCMIRGARAAKRAPSRQDLRAVYSQTAVCGAFRIHNAHILPKPAHFGYMAAKCCHEPALFPSEAPSGTHGTKKLPCLTARERATATSCHGSPRGNAFREHFAAGERPGTHRGIISPTTVRPLNAPRPTAPSSPQLPLGSSSNTTPCAAAPSCYAPPAALFPPLKSKLQVTGVDVVERTTSFALSAIFGLTYSPHQRAWKRGGTVCA